MPSRHHRRATRAQGFAVSDPWRVDLSWLVAPQRLNWWIGTLFAIGSVCFAVASALQLWPMERALIEPALVNWVYFAGSIPFTTAGGLVLMQAAHAPAIPNAKDRGRMPFPGYKPHNLGWWSAALQFLGTLLFNVNTFCGALVGLSVQTQIVWVWGPNFIGSVLFLVSGLLAYREAVHRWFHVEFNSLTWWTVVINLLGCVGFMISAIAAYTSPEGELLWPTLATAATFQGALCFLLGAWLSLAESAHEDSSV